MRQTFLVMIGVFCLLLQSSLGAAQNLEAPSLESVLRKMDAATAGFQTTQADFVWDQYQKVVGETDTQKGTVYYRRSGKEIEMMADIKFPEQKFLLYKDGKLQVYQPKIEQIMEYTAGANHREIESYLVLGFGGSGKDLQREFDVTYQGDEMIDNVPTARLHLTPKSETVRKYFTEACLWIDVSSGVSLQQKFMEGQGDYRVAKYSAVKVNAKINNDIFRLKTTGKTKTVSPRG